MGEGAVSFEQWIEGQVSELIRLGEVDFGNLLRRLPGVYPGDALPALERVAARDAQLATDARGLIRSAKLDLPSEPSETVALGLLHPHPLDYEWRFKQAAVEVLVRRCNERTPSNGPVALVATPTVAMAKNSLFGDRPVTYIGADTAMLDRRGLPSHVRRTIPRNLLERGSDPARFATLIMDPPWYDEHLQRFLWFASRALRTDGVLLLAMPAPGTRPGVSDDHARQRAWCGRLGFKVEDVEPGALPYETPLFERNALRAAGILNVPSDWRRGDLWTVRKVGASRAVWPGDMAKTGWAENRFGQVRVRVDRAAPEEGGHPALVTLVVGDVLPTVSRRDPRRRFARVWTTGNRVFGCSAPAELGRILDDWQTGSLTATVPEGVKRDVIAQMAAILDVEGIEVDGPIPERPAQTVARRTS